MTHTANVIDHAETYTYHHATYDDAQTFEVKAA